MPTERERYRLNFSTPENPEARERIQKATQYVVDAVLGSPLLPWQARILQLRPTATTAPQEDPRERVERLRAQALAARYRGTGPTPGRLDGRP